MGLNPPSIGCAAVELPGYLVNGTAHCPRPLQSSEERVLEEEVCSDGIRMHCYAFSLHINAYLPNPGCKATGNIVEFPGSWADFPILRSARCQ